MKEPKAKDCPFCGGRAVKFRCRTINYTHKATFAADFGCENCNALMIGTGFTPEEAWIDAITNWNKRAKDRNMS